MWDGKNHSGERRPCKGALCVLVASLSLAACSTLDSLNPFSSASEGPAGDPRISNPKVEGDFPKISSVPNAPQANSAAERREIVRGLIADRENARYTEEAVRRDGTPTRPLAPSPTAQAVPAQGQVAAAQQPAAAPPAPANVTSPVQQRGGMPAAAAVPQRGAVAAAPVPAAPLPPPPPYEPSSQTAIVTPGRPGVPPAPGQLPPTLPAGPTVMDYFRQRLAESAQQQIASVARSEFTGAPMGQPVNSMTPPPVPAQVPAQVPMAAPPQAMPQVAPQSSLQVAPLASMGAPPASAMPFARLSFAQRSTRLGQAEMAALREVARVQRQHGGQVRVVGAASGESNSRDPVRQLVDDLDLSVKRAEAVSKELTRLGVPARNIVVETAATGLASGGAPRTEIFIQY